MSSTHRLGHLLSFLTGWHKGRRTDGHRVLVELARDVWKPAEEFVSDLSWIELDNQWESRKQNIGDLSSLASLAKAKITLLTVAKDGDLGSVCDLLWLDIEQPSGKVLLPSATYGHARRQYIDSIGRRDNLHAELNKNLLLIVSLHGPDYALPDLVLVGPTDVSLAGKGKAVTTHAGDRVVKIELSREIEGAHGMSGVSTLLEPLASLGDPAGWTTLFRAPANDDVRSRVRKDLKQRLAQTMMLLERQADRYARRHATTEVARAEGRRASDSDLPILREAATLIAFRLMFLREVERRRLLFGTEGTPELTLAELSAQVSAGVHEAGTLLDRFRALCAAMRDEPGSPNVALRGASIFRTSPSEAFDARLADWLLPFDARDEAVDDRREWDELIAGLGSVVLGFLDDARERQGALAQVGHGTLGLGGTEHAHRILGDVYEQVLALVPRRSASGAIELTVGSAGTSDKDERSQLGAHYTPEVLVSHIARPVVGALFDNAAAASRLVGDTLDVGAYVKRLSDLRIVDPAMGSGHFLTVVAAEIAREIAFAERYGRPRTRHEPAEEFDPEHEVAEEDLADFRDKVRRLVPDVVRTSCYGVDVNPLAVELGKLALWLFTLAVQDRVPTGERVVPELAFLDGNLRSGDSLVGLTYDQARAILDARLPVTQLQTALFSDGPARDSVNERWEALVELQSHLRDSRTALFVWAKSASGMRLLGDTPLPIDAYSARVTVLAAASARLAPLRWYFDLAVLAELLEARKNKDEELRDAINGQDPDLALPANRWSWSDVLSEPIDTSHAVVRRVRAAIPRALMVAGHSRTLRPMHWAIEFPEIFGAQPGVRSGFDGVVSNPPFLGDRDLRGRLGEPMVKYLCRRYTEARNGGTPDLCGFFVLRFDDLLAPRGAVAGTLAPNTVAQSKNRTAVLVPLVASGALRLFRGVQNLEWPGEAAVHVCFVHLARRDVVVQPRIAFALGDGEWSVRRVESVSTMLDEYADAPATQLAPVSFALRSLPSSATDLFWTGMFLRGADGTPGDFVKPMSFLEQARAHGEERVVYGYLNNKAVQSQSRPTPRNVCVDFFDALEEAGLRDAAAPVQLAWLEKHYPFCLASIHDVRLARESLPDSSSNREHKIRWWLFGSPRHGMRAAWKGQDVVYAVGAVGKIWGLHALSKIDLETGARICPMHKLFIFPNSSLAAFATFSSFLGEIHIRRQCSTLKADLNFTPENSLPTLPFPWPSAWSEATGHPTMLPPPAEVEAALGPAAKAVLDARAARLSTAADNYGPTSLYNDYDDPNDTSAEIDALRRAHRVLLDAVLRAYGFTALADTMIAAPDAGWTFDTPWIDGSTRYVPAAPHRRSMIEQLADLNERRYWDELRLYRPFVEAALSPKSLSEKQLEKRLKDQKVRFGDGDVAAMVALGVREGWLVQSGVDGPIRRK